MLNFIAHYWKAVAGFLAPGVALFVAALADGSVTQAEWVRIVTACVAGAVGVAAAPANKRKATRKPVVR